MVGTEEETHPIVTVDPQLVQGAVGTNGEQFGTLVLSQPDGPKEQLFSNILHNRSGPQNHLEYPTHEHGSSSSIGGHKHPTAPTTQESTEGNSRQVHPSGHVLLRVIVCPSSVYV